MRFLKCSFRCGAALVVAVAVAASAHAQGGKDMMPDPARVGEIAAMMNERPGTFGAPVANREIWDSLARDAHMQEYLKRQERQLDQPVPELTTAMYRSNVESGSRKTWFDLHDRRGARIKSLVLAECLENKGRFMPKLEEVLRSIFQDKTWIVALRKQQSLDNWDGKANQIDLGKAMQAWEVALAASLVGEKMDPALRRQLGEELERRVFEPYRKMLDGRQKPDWWMTTTNNWNAVCLAGVTGAALTALESPDERALFLAAAEKHSKNFLKGFPSDGYCTEGLSYWDFGFSHYLALCEAGWRATKGRLDLLDVPNIRNIALYGARIEIMNGVYPSIADCPPTARPDPMIMDFVSRRLGLGLERWETDELNRRFRGNLYLSLMHVLPNSATLHPAADIARESIGARTYFDEAGILICRPGESSQARMGVCLKGGHNAEHHNHNDVGTFIVAIDAQAPIVDSGAEVYTNRTFSNERYDSDALNSYGHSVPFVAGRMQEKGREAAAKVLRADFTEMADTFAIDLRSCYDVPALEKLERTFVYSRSGAGALTVTDEVAFSSPQAFETALITLGRYRIVGSDSVVLYDTESAALATVRCDEAQVGLRAETLEADLRVPDKARRIAIALDQPVRSARLTVAIAPTDHPEGASLEAIRNGGFEEGAEGWEHPKKGMGAISAEQAFSGKQSLKIADGDSKGGSNWLSSRMKVKPGGVYELRGQVFPVQGGPEDLGVYVRFYDRTDKRIGRERAERLKSIVLTGGNARKWQPISRRFQVTRATEFVRIWVHSMSAAKVTAYLDDLEVVAAPQ